MGGGSMCFYLYIAKALHLQHLTHHICPHVKTSSCGVSAGAGKMPMHQVGLSQQSVRSPMLCPSRLTTPACSTA